MSFHFARMLFNLFVLTFINLSNLNSASKVTHCVKNFSRSKETEVCNNRLLMSFARLSYLIRTNIT